MYLDVILFYESLNYDIIILIVNLIHLYPNIAYQHCKTDKIPIIMKQLKSTSCTLKHTINLHMYI